MLKYSIQLLFFLLIVKLSWSQTVFTDFDDFKDACKTVQPGDELILANGTYDAESVKIEDVEGTEEQPIIIRAEEIGKVILNEGTYFDLRHSSHVIIQGFVINIYEKSTTFKIQTCNHIRITQNWLDGSNEPFYKEDDETDRNSSVWISIQSLWDDPVGLSHHNQIDHNTFQNKYTLGNIIRIDGTNEEQVSQYDVIEYNHFKNMGPRADNEMEAIRVGWSEMSESDGFCTIQNNLFEECNGDPEIISVKCNKNTIAHNTFKRCQGTLSLRHGNESVIEGNFFLGEGAEGTGGVRFYGSDHRIINNYFEGLTGTRWDAPITLTEGDADEGNGSLSKHFRIERAIIANNTVVNCDYGIEIGYDNNGKYSKPPRDVVFANNIISGIKNSLVNYINDPIDITWSDNILYATADAEVGTNITFTNDEAGLIDPVLQYDSEFGMYKPTPNSPTYTTFNNVVGNINIDVEGQVRNAPYNYGADELESSAVLYKPLAAKDVGVSTGEYLNISPSTLNVLKEGGSQYIAITSNLSWKIVEDANWLSVSTTEGDGDNEVAIEVLENTTGEIRTAQISIETINADELIQKTIAIVQAEISVPYLTVKKQAYSISSVAETVALEISSNTTWSVSTLVDWIEISQSTGNGDENVEITIHENKSVAPRNAIVLVNDESNINLEIAIGQDGADNDAVKLPIVSAVASDEEAEKGNVAENVFDGDLENRWSGEGDGAHITLDMGEEYKVAFIKAGVYKANERHSMFDILSSTDGVTFQEELMNITTELTEESLIIYDFEDVKARYVRIVGHGNSSSEWNSYSEFEIWGYDNETSLNELRKSQSLTIFPNPAENIIFIDGVDNKMVEVYNLRGVCILKQKCSGSINVKELKPGVYFVKTIDNKNIIMVSSFVKK
ncbi:MAG: discoidin domain-containing protein [Prolixibacteraceae bacterium]|jgi:poly(beta-D-mannuronate) lyase|nr:discoidin domain-containing protein [Prolixibacteraceae bacterium]